MKEMSGYHKDLDVLQYALTEVEYYRSRNLLQVADDNMEKASAYFSDFPNLTIDSIFKSYGELIADPYQKFPKSQNVAIRRVFETDGNMFKMIWDNDDLTKSNNTVREIRRELYGVDPDARFCSFYTALYRANKIMEEDATQLLERGKSMAFNVFNLDDEKLKNIFIEMTRFAPVWLLLRPSIA